MSSRLFLFFVSAVIREKRILGSAEGSRTSRPDPVSGLTQFPVSSPPQSTRDRTSDIRRGDQIMLVGRREISQSRMSSAVVEVGSQS